MRFLAQLAAVASSLVTLTAATALTYNLPANSKECFYAHVDNKGAKVAFYFAVCIRQPASKSTTETDISRSNPAAHLTVHLKYSSVQLCY